MCRYIKSTVLKILDETRLTKTVLKCRYEKITCEEYKDTFLHFRTQMLLLIIPEVYDSYKIQVKAGRAQGNNTGQRRMGIYFSTKNTRYSQIGKSIKSLEKKSQSCKAD